jgi:error-prone DNA polymerase
VEVREVDVNLSDWDCTLEALGESLLPVQRGEGGLKGRMRGGAGLESQAPYETPILDSAQPLIRRHRPSEGRSSFRRPMPPPSLRSTGRRGEPSIHPRHAEMADHILTTHAVRLGFRQITGANEKDMKLIVERRGGGYDSIRDLWLRTGLGAAVIERLAEADAFRSLGLDRRAALWAARGLDRVGDQDNLPLFSASRPQREHEPDAFLPPMPLGAHVVEDYRRLSLSLKAHPVAFMRARLDTRSILRCEQLAKTPSGARVAVSGLVLVRQRPGTASGVVFMTLEDETGIANIIVWPKVFEKLRAIVIGARFVAVTGKLQSESGVIHVVAERMEDLTPMLGLLSERGEEIDARAHADEARTSRPDPREKRPGNRACRPPALTAPAVAPPEQRDLLDAVPLGRRFH